MTNGNNNRYYQLVSGLTPNDMLQKFSQSAPRNVQEAVKSTIVSILGSLPNYALDAALITTNSKLANLMFQMQITGYMFKNAEYRMSLTKSLKGESVYGRMPSLLTCVKMNTSVAMGLLP